MPFARTFVADVGKNDGRDLCLLSGLSAERKIRISLKVGQRAPRVWSGYTVNNWHGDLSYVVVIVTSRCVCVLSELARKQRQARLVKHADCLS